MKNCLILGSARSGTSMLGGMLFNSGYFMGDNLYPPNETNPKGFFECDFINGINEHILIAYDDQKKHDQSYFSNYKNSPFKPNYGQRWLAYFDHDTNVNNLNEEIEHKIRLALAEPVFAYKDPRLNFTIPIWNKFLNLETVFIVMFRNPIVTIQSVLDECKRSDYLKDFYIDKHLAETIWQNNYLSILKHVQEIGMDRFLFIEYEQLLKGEKTKVLNDFLDAKIIDNFPTSLLNRTKSNIEVSEETIGIFENLLKLSK